jgi:crossover junction endodeoxyribonuclease RusA
MSLLITLPLPPKELSPNARVHWGRKARATKKYRLTASVCTDIALKDDGVEGDYQQARVQVKLFNRTAHRRDGDNLIATLKSAFDGIADALYVDDAEWTHLPPMQETDKDDPRVEVHLAPKTK